MTTVPLQREFEYYIEHQKEWAQQHEGRFVVVAGQELLGFYDDEVEALQETVKTHEAGTFIVHKVSFHEETLIYQRVTFP